MIQFGIALPCNQKQFVDMKSLCIASYLVLSTTSATIPWSKLRSDLGSCCLKLAQARRHEAIGQRGLFGVEHDALNEPMVQAPISVGILLL